MYSKIRIIISSSFFGAGLRKKKKKNIRIFLNRNIAFGRIIYIYQSMTMSPMYNIFDFKTTAQYQSWIDGFSLFKQMILNDVQTYLSSG